MRKNTTEGKGDYSEDPVYLGVSEVKVVLCPILCNPLDCIVHGILQARILEWVAFPIPSKSSRPRNPTGVSALQVNSLPTEL